MPVLAKAPFVVEARQRRRGWHGCTWRSRGVARHIRQHVLAGRSGMHARSGWLHPRERHSCWSVGRYVPHCVCSGTDLRAGMQRVSGKRAEKSNPSAPARVIVCGVARARRGRRRRGSPRSRRRRGQLARRGGVGVAERLGEERVAPPGLPQRSPTRTDSAPDVHRRASLDRRRHRPGGLSSLSQRRSDQRLCACRRGARRWWCRALL